MLTPVANAVIMNSEGQFLMTQRYDPDNPKIHMLWQIPGGGVDENETPQNACIREAYEETGIKVKLLTQTPFIIKQTYPEAEFLLHGFLTEPISGTINTENDEETHDAKWCSFEELKELKMLDNTVQMIDGVIKIWKNDSSK